MLRAAVAHGGLETDSNLAKLGQPQSLSNGRPCECQGCTSEPRTTVAASPKKCLDKKLLPRSVRQQLMEKRMMWVKWWNEPEYFIFQTTKRKSNSLEDEVHHQTDSLFSSSSGFSNYRGLVNLCIVLLALSNARVALENVIKYGILINPVTWVKVFLSQPYSLPCVVLMLILNVFILFAYVLEVLLSKGAIAEGLGKIGHTLNLLAHLTFPAVVILYVHPNPVFSIITLGSYTVTFLKLVSYSSVNRWCRISLTRKNNPSLRKRTKSTADLAVLNGNGSSSVPKTEYVKYPDNVTLSNIYYFTVCPTLSYELNFPRSGRIRKRFLLKRLLEMAILAQVLMGLIQQWIIPTVNNSMKPFHNSNYSHLVERCLKLSVPNHIIWLIFFYWFFHSCLNVVAELTMFGDREFYQDWWNSESISRFWSTWNIPVHRWARRHVFVPLLERGYSKFSASVIVFIVSAFFHEYLVSIPLRMFRLWAFFGMISQVPLAFFVGKYLRGHLGNMALWVSLIIGQPMAILMYVHDYYIMNNLHEDMINS